jgi:hypothetical protein
MPQGHDEDGLISLVLRPLADTVPVSVRLRAALKTLLRRDRLKCVRVSGMPAAMHQTTKAGVHLVGLARLAGSLPVPLP